MKPPRSPIDDDQDATEALLNVAGTKMFDHQLAQLRQQRMDQAAYAEAAAHYEAQGYTVLPERPQWRDRSRVGLRHLRTADGDIASEEAVTNPAHWAIVVASQSPWRMPMPVLPVTEDDDDGVIGVDEDLEVRTAPLGVMSGAVVGVVTGCPSC